VKEKRKTLPIQGAKLIQLTFTGNGKDSELRIEVEGFPHLVVMLSCAQMKITSKVNLLTETTGPDENGVEIRMWPLRKGSVLLKGAVVFFSGTDEEWKETRKRWREHPQSWDSWWCVNRIELRLVSVP
jgi:hypothetical protein